MKKLYFTLILICSLFSISNGQWVAQPSNITTGLYVQFIDAVDTNVVWGLAADPLNQLTPVQEFTKTVDGGNLWISNPIANALGLSPSGLYALNADTAWVVMFNGTTGGGALLKTEDGGTNWNVQSTATFAAPAGFPNIVHFFDANNGVTMGDPNGGYFEIYTTTDGGTNWVRTPQANIAAQQSGEFGITSVYTANGDSTLWFGTNLGRIYKTTDRGLNWTVASTPYTGSYIGDIAFRDANNGIATNGSPGALADAIRTTDGGATWNLIPANTAGILNKVLSFVPGTDSTYFLSSPQLGGGTAFSLTDANSWVLVDNLIHSDVEFVAPTTGYTGSNELNAPMFKWVGPIQVNCATLLGPLQFVTSDSICTGESIDYSIHVDFTSDPQNRIGFNAVFYDEFFTQIGAQSVPDLVAAGFPNTFVPDPGQTTIGTLNFTIFFTVAATNEVVHFGIQAFPTQCSDDTSNFLVNSVFQDVSLCGTAVTLGTSATVDLSGCPQTGQVNYTYSYSVNGGPQIPGNQFNCTSNNGINNITFYIDNGGCVRELTTTVNCVGVGIDEIGANSFSLYPNPVNEMLFLEINNSVDFDSFVITDVSGREVTRFNNSGTVNHKVEIPVKDLSSGTYFVTMLNKSNSPMKVQRFVKL